MDIINIHHSIIYLFAFSLHLLLGIFVWCKNPKIQVNEIFFRLELCLSIWGLGYGILSLVKSIYAAQWGLILPRIFIPFIFSTYFHFSLIITRRYEGVHRVFCRISYLVSGSLAILDLCTKCIVSGVAFSQFGYYPVAGRLYPLFLFSLISFILYGTIMLIIRWRTTKNPVEKKRLFLLWLGILIALGGGLINAFLVYHSIVRVPPWPYLGHLISTFYAIIVAYAIFKYKLMDIVIRKTAIYGIFITIALGIFITGILIFDRLLDIIGLKSPVFLTGFIITVITFIIASIFHPQERIKQFVDRYLFPGRYSREQRIKRFSEDIEFVRDKDSLLTLTINTLKEIVPVNKVSLLLLNKERGRYEISAPIGMNNSREIETTVLKEDELIINWFKKNKKGLLKEEVEKYPEKFFKEIQKQKDFEKADVVLFMPILWEGELLGLLGLGKMIEEISYTDEDLELLLQLCNKVGVGLERIKRYELEEKTYNLEKRAEELITLHKISSHIQKAMNLDKIIYLTLTGITFGKAVLKSKFSGFFFLR